MPFGKIHAAFNPKARGQVAPAPKFGGEQDLIGISAAPPPALAVPNASGIPTAARPQATSATEDIMGLFQNVSVSQPQAAGPVGHDPFAAPPVQAIAPQAQTGIPNQALSPQLHGHQHSAPPAHGHVAVLGQQSAYAPNQPRMIPQAPSALQPPQGYAAQQMVAHQQQNGYASNPQRGYEPALGQSSGYPQGQPHGRGGYPPAQQGYAQAPVSQQASHTHGQHPNAMQHPGHPAVYGAPAQQQQQYQSAQQPNAPRPPSSQFDPFG